MKIGRRCVLLLIGILAFGRNRNTSNPSSPTDAKNSAPSSESPLIIRANDSPTNGDSREPEFNATHDGVSFLVG